MHISNFILCSLAHFFSYKKSLLSRFPASCFVSFPQLLSPPHHSFRLYPLLSSFFSHIAISSSYYLFKRCITQPPQQCTIQKSHFSFSADLNHPGSEKNRILISGSCPSPHWVSRNAFVLRKKKMGSSASKATSSSSSSSSSWSFRKGRSKGYRGFPSSCLGATSGSRGIDSDDQVTLNFNSFASFSMLRQLDFYLKD